MRVLAVRLSDTYGLFDSKNRRNRQKTKITLNVFQGMSNHESPIFS